MIDLVLEGLGAGLCLAGSLIAVEVGAGLLCAWLLREGGRR